jgi:hypothetical protein
MIQFLCDTCSAIKQPGETWILGLAAEAVGLTGARREVAIMSDWDRPRAVHPLAVHFCSEACKDAYMDRLFGDDRALESGTARVRARSTVKKPAKKRSLVRARKKSGKHAA